MYEYKKLSKDTSNDTFEPSDNMRINGVAVNELVEGYRHLTVSGRGLIGQRVGTKSVPARRGVWVDEINDLEREIEVKYRLEADSSALMRDRFAKLNKVLRNGGNILEITFKDEPDYTYYGYFTKADDIEEKSLKNISKFTILIPDGYKKKNLESSTTGMISLVDADKVLPQRIEATMSTTANNFKIMNDKIFLEFNGNYNSGEKIVIDFSGNEIIATISGRNILQDISLHSPLEVFYIANMDKITASNANITLVSWRDERL